MSWHVKIQYFLSKMFKYALKAEKWLQLRWEPTPHFLPPCSNIARQLEEFSFAFLVACLNDQSLPHFIYPPPLQQDKWMTPSQLYIQTHNLRMIFRHVGEYPGQRKSRKLVKTRKCTPPPLTPFSDNTLLRHVDQSCFSPWTLWTMRLTLWANSKYLPVRTLRSSTKILEIVDMEAICVAPAGDWEMSKLFQYSNSKQRNVEDPYNFVIWDFPTEDIRGDWIKDRQSRI